MLKIFLDKDTPVFKDLAFKDERGSLGKTEGTPHLIKDYEKVYDDIYLIKNVFFTPRYLKVTEGVTVEDDIIDVKPVTKKTKKEQEVEAE